MLQWACKEVSLCGQGDLVVHQQERQQSEVFWRSMHNKIRTVLTSGITGNWNDQLVIWPLMAATFFIE